MAAGPSVGAQLRDMMSALERYEQSTTTTEPQSKDLSLMTLLWPLLPLLPPEPPLLVSEMLRRPDKCDLCGTSQGTPLSRRAPKSGREPTDTSSGVRDRTPLDRLMMDVEKQLDETLDSLQDTVEKNTELSREANEIQKLRTNEMSDAELLKMLKKLTKEKAEKMEKVNILEIKEQQLKESLTTAIGWAKSVELRKGVLNEEKLTNVRTSIQKELVLGDAILENTYHESAIPEKGDFKETITEKVRSEEIITEVEDIEGTTTEHEDAREHFVENEGGEENNTDKETEVIERRRLRFRGM